MQQMHLGDVILIMLTALLLLWLSIRTAERFCNTSNGQHATRSGSQG